MSLFENIQAVSDHFVMPVKIVTRTGKRSAAISVPGKRPVQVKAALDLLKKKGLLENTSSRQLEDCVSISI